MNNPYATNKGGKIPAPKKPQKDDPRVVREVANDGRDLRSRK